MSKDGFHDLRELLSRKKPPNSERKVTLVPTPNHPSPQSLEQNVTLTNIELKDIRRKRFCDQQDNNYMHKRICHNDRTSITTSHNAPPAGVQYREGPNTPFEKSGESISKIPGNKRFSERSVGYYGTNRMWKEAYIADQNNNYNNAKKSKLCHGEQNSSTTANTAYTTGGTRKCGHQIHSKFFKTGESISRNLNNQELGDTTRTPTPMSYTYLKNLSDDQMQPEDTSLKLTEPAQLQRFEALLRQNEPIRYDLMKMIVLVIDKVGQSTLLTHLNIILGIMNKTRFWSTLGIFIAELETNEECLADTEVFLLLKNLCKIFSISLERLSNLHSHIPIHQLQSAVKFFKENENVPIDSTVDILLTDVEDKFTRVKKRIRERGQSQAEPPDDFRTLSIFPTAEDILKGGKPFLRENLVKQAFSSVDQYLDIHFRLLKEDSVAGLRNGVRDLQRSYRQQQYGAAAVDSLSKLSIARPRNDVNVYNEVVINEQVATNGRNNTKGIVYNVAFNSNHPSIKRVNWERSKRLMFGSLVCLISTDFTKVHVGTVGDRRPDMLKEGYIQLCFEGNEYPGYDDMRDEYQMVESSSAYFVAYRHILKQLQQIKEETMPFKNYIVFCEHEIAKPAYYKVKSEEENPKEINLKSIVDKDMNSRESLQDISPFDLSIWPDGETIGLNDSQYKAFQSALQREFTVIQGPPGTGKTYLGLKIAHTLLDNNHLWKDKENTKSCPILMLAYTNHALDSFLEGLTINLRDIIRVGGRSSSEALKECNINIVRRDRGRQNLEYQDGLRRRRLREVQRTKEECELSLNRYTYIYAKSFKGILPARKLEEFMLVEHKEYLSNDNIMLEFLELSLNAEAKQNATKLANEEETFEEFNGHELGGHFHVGNVEVDEKRESKNQVLICFAEETLSPKRLLELLKTETPEHERTGNLETRTLGGDILLLSAEEKWSLYLLWITRLRESLRGKIREKQTKHVELSSEYEELRNIEDLGIMRNSRVVGMTTTCASRNHKLLQQLRPRVVIIEEAAELFEAHIVTCLTEYCQHLILIGDHQQLRPNSSVYNLSKKYSLDVSLLERMIEAGVPYNRLSVQHRMRPEISKIFRHIYDGLEDHTSVMEYENIRGVAKNLFFVDHDVPESVYDNIHSKVNQHEAEFLVELCLYLLRQGYKSSQITILTTYTGQMFKIRDLVKSKKDEFEEDLPPRVSNVDNFQGEENDIILLSLVRNNEEENIGFLKIKNRVCVALSRARKGLYITGNRKMLTNQSLLWKDVLADFDENGCIGKLLPLVCSIHQTKTSVASAADFREFVPNGGCLEKCQDRLGCGHACPQMCHPNGHKNFKCEKPCTQNVNGCGVLGHKCTKLCHEMCDDICQYPVVKVLHCGHKMTLACSDDIRSVKKKCTERCEKTLRSCGHRCQSTCGASCSQQCMELVKKTDLACGHQNTMACSATQKDCPVPCDATLECDHPCIGKCGQCIQGRVHVKCAKKCNRILICSHQCKSKCNKNCPPCTEGCTRKCYNSHSKCTKRCGEICVPCKEPCLWECDHHKCTKLCSDFCDRPRCNQPCNRELACGKRLKGKPHFCHGLCGERCICIICDKNNGEDVTTILFGSEDEGDARFIRLEDCEHIFECNALDKMMDSNNDSGEIKTKVCPLCSVPIVKSLRYGNVVKGIHQDIDDIKRKILDSTIELEEKTTLVKILESELSPEITLTLVKMKSSSIERSWKIISNYIRKCEPSPVYYQDILLVESVLLLLKNWLRIKKSYEGALAIRCQKQSQTFTSHIEFDSEMQNVLGRILVIPAHTSIRILNQLNLELQRMSLKRDVLLLKLNCASLEVNLHEVDGKIVKGILTKLQNRQIIEEDSIEKFRNGISEIYSRNPHISPITKEEKIQIVRAIGLKQGHWFKCPKGHVYAIGECGGAMEESKCPECGAIIGGQHHRLAGENEVATEMDGATFPAWSDEANMENYQFDD